MIVCVDGGHGGTDGGASGATGSLEKDFALSQSLVFASLATDAGHEVVQTRAADIFVSLAQRVQRANESDADAFVSFHWNASSSPEPHGTIVMCHQNSIRGTQLAQEVLREVAPLTRPEPTIPTRWEKVWQVPDGQDGSRWEHSAPAVIARTMMPAVLIEVDFGTNPAAEQRMSNGEAGFLIGVAEAVVRALETWADAA